jgi:hypothetical protein
MGLAHAHRAERNEERALLEFRAARSGFERVGAVLHAAEAARACGDAQRDDMPQRALRHHDSRTTVPVAGENVFRREGDTWSVAFDGHATRLRDLKGLHYIARLLADPGRNVHVLDMAGAVGGAADTNRSAGDDLSFASDMDAGVMLDAQAKEGYRRRLAEIDEDIEEAEEAGDEERAIQAGNERDFLIRELARAVGLGGRDRRAGSASERARASVTRAVRQAMNRIDEYHPALGEHLSRAIRTGTYCAYRPDPRASADWKL